MSESDYHERVWESIPEGLEPQWWRARTAFLLERVHGGERVLDVGCGEGRFAAELAAAGAEVLGLDVAHEPLRRARARYPDLDLRHFDARVRWPLEDASFDVVWAGEVIEHVCDTAGWLSEARRVLRSGGRLLLSTPAHPRLLRLALALSAPAFDAHFDPRGEHLRFYTARTLTGLLEDFGFAQVEVSSAGPLRVGRPLLLASAQRKRF